MAKKQEQSTENTIAAECLAVRLRTLRLTRKGRGLLERAKPKWDEAQTTVKELLGEHAFDNIEEVSQQVRGRNIKK